jgi:hypothetical protein
LPKIAWKSSILFYRLNDIVGGFGLDVFGCCGVCVFHVRHNNLIGKYVNGKTQMIKLFLSPLIGHCSGYAWISQRSTLLASESVDDAGRLMMTFWLAIDHEARWLQLRQAPKPQTSSFCLSMTELPWLDNLIGGRYSRGQNAYRIFHGQFLDFAGKYALGKINRFVPTMDSADLLIAALRNLLHPHRRLRGRMVQVDMDRASIGWHNL